jgi:hypothetical protein
MRRVVLACGCGLAVLLCSAGLLFVERNTQQNAVPSGATNVRVYRYGLSQVHVIYELPAEWTLQDLYRYQASQGWVRDQASERSLQRNWSEVQTTVFAIFLRQRLFGLVSEAAFVGPPWGNRLRIQVRLVRCFKIEPWTECL